MPTQILPRQHTVLFLIFTLFSPATWGHEVKVEQQMTTAAVVHLTYANGHAFAFAAYELYLPEQNQPSQVGRTNANGQVIFLPQGQRTWRLKAYTADGHGVDQLLNVPTVPTAATVVETKANHTNDPTDDRPLLLLAGLGMLFGLFGSVQLFLRKKGKHA